MKKTLSADDLRAFRSMRQGLDGSLAGRSPAEVLERTGWVRSVGGASPYLALFARAGTSREAADAAIAAIAIHELPSARGCTYVVPAADHAVALRAGQDAARSAEDRHGQEAPSRRDRQGDRPPSVGPSAARSPRGRRIRRS